MYGTVNFKSVPAFGDCLICKGELSEKPSLAHDGGKKCEPCHEDCLKTWVKVNNICPKCHAKVDLNSLFPWKERTIIQIKAELKLMGKDALSGAFFWLAVFVMLLATVNSVLMIAKETIVVTEAASALVVGVALGGGSRSCSTWNQKKISFLRIKKAIINIC